MNSLRMTSRVAGLLKGLAGLVLLVVSASAPASAGQQDQVGVYDINVSHGLTFTGRSNDPPAPLALRGYDPVSYFTDGKPQLGTVQHAVLHDGAIYWFTSGEHQKMFQLEPGRYLPQYGGFCAYGVTQKTKFDGDPLLWNIHRGKLYLNVTPALQDKWLGKGLINGVTGRNLDANVADADRNWSSIRNSKPQSLFKAWLANQ
jgi:YHS domain-containing protein